MENVTYNQWEELVNQSPAPVLVKFGAEWCQPCHKIAPMLAELEAEYKGKVLFLTVDADKESKLIQRYGVMSLPTIIFFFGDKHPIEKIVGAKPKSEYKKALERILLTAK